MVVQAPNQRRLRNFFFVAQPPLLAPIRGTGVLIPPAPELPSGKYGAKTGIGKDLGNRFAMVSLNFDSSFLDRASGATNSLHLFAKQFFFLQTDACKVGHYRYGLPAAVCRLAKNIHAATIVL